MLHSRWKVTIKTPMGERSGMLDLQIDGKKLSGSLSDAEHHAVIEEGRADGSRLSWTAKVTKPMRLSLKFTAVIDADQISGTAKHLLGSATFSGVRVQPAGT